MASSEVNSRLDDWVANNLLSAQQADAIRTFESARAKPPVAPVVGEVLGYVGGALSISALLAIVTQFWTVLGAAGQIGLAALVTAACLAGGWIFAAGATPQAKRLGYFLLLLGTVASGFLTGLITDWAGAGYDIPLLAGAFGALVVAVAVWWRHRTALQVVGITVAVAFLVPAIAERWLAAVAQEFIGLSFLLLGALAALAGEREWFPPRNAAWAVGCLGMLIGPQALAAESWSSAGAYLVLGCLIATALMGIALWRGRGVPLGFGAAGIVIFVPQTLYRFFEGTIGVPIALLLAGVLLVVMSAVVIKVRPRLRAGRES